MNPASGSSRVLLGVVGLAATLGGAGAILAQASSGAQPWSAELSDNLVFAKAIPFVLGLGVVVGLLLSGQVGARTERRKDGALRRFRPATVVGHWVCALGILLALVTGVWQYLGGILDVEAPVPLYLFYRVHYLGATLLLFTVSAFATRWWLEGDRSLLVPSGQWIRHLRGLAHELPRPLGTMLAGLLGLDMRRRPPLVDQFTYYEKVVSFPTWTFVIALITVTGVVKAMRYVFPVPGPVLFWASTIHVAAMVLMAVKVLDHLRYTFARWPLLVAMVTTWVSEGYVRARHPGWFRTVQQQEGASVEAESAGAASGAATAAGVAGGGRR